MDAAIDPLDGRVLLLLGKFAYVAFLVGQFPGRAPRRPIGQGTVS